MSSEPPTTVAAALPSQPPLLAADGPVVSKIRHHLLFRDTVTFLVLTAITVVLFSVTLLLFRSFAAHQQQLARQYSERGRAELAGGHPEQAVASLRAALQYAPGERTDELRLAQALGDAGHAEESYTYFTGLWDRTPGDGFINLRLARLAATKGDREDAVNFYRAAIFGTWPGDAIVRRQGARLELAEYLLAQRQFAPAREELLIAGSNAGPNAELDRRVSELLLSTGDPHDALDYALKVLADRPTDAGAAMAAARLADQLGDTGEARRLADRAMHLLGAAKPETPAVAASLADVRALRFNLERLEALDPAETLPSAERVRRLLTDSSIAQQRLASCLASATLPAAASLHALSSRWAVLQPSLNPRTLSHAQDTQDRVLQLIDSTETVASQSCGPTTGDDALLLRLARQHAQASGQTATPTLEAAQP